MLFFIGTNWNLVSDLFVWPRYDFFSASANHFQLLLFVYFVLLSCRSHFYFCVQTVCPSKTAEWERVTDSSETAADSNQSH